MLSESGSVLDLFRLTGAVAIVTGAGSGLGAGFAEALAEAGADVVIAGRRRPQLEATAEKVRQAGGACLAVPTDVTSPDACAALVDAAVAEFGRVDVLVNNAGMSHVAPATAELPEDFRAVLDVNLNGAYWMAQASARVMGHGSSIVNVSSMLGLMKSTLPQAAYAASKAGLIGLTRDLSNQWSARKGIRVNAIAPGFVETDMISEMSEDTLAGFLATCPLGRVATQREIDTAVVFLAARASSYITGSTLAVDGGTSGH
ncbi:glucose 1-dehydrogenase [Mycolicibacterium fluoranthenivorans]|jgi:NAD(P)-dependent dehydrogenase (short-subunit alcohol dehydrogenase family)|uniref:Glucose 1-dehydrogenase n=1 Tax=Mycolicibacterium fluoranthenivorans TaxID=258505 RepID=A0A7G8PK35_9MYCO|nr:MULTISPECIES: glucose 1-dehydrogenase [Mycobacteriaceae]MCV7252324.1 glucose 1-dehydrogenase [Mycobacterium hackensackense]QNJ94701.1 glucose 1-dehydrogenase [Mycolicibacterium fluoranthenivorans]